MAYHWRSGASVFDWQGWRFAKFGCWQGEAEVKVSRFGRASIRLLFISDFKRSPVWFQCLFPAMCVRQGLHRQGGSALVPWSRVAVFPACLVFSYVLTVSVFHMVVGNASPTGNNAYSPLSAAASCALWRRIDTHRYWECIRTEQSSYVDHSSVSGGWWHLLKIIYSYVFLVEIETNCMP